MDGKQIAKDLLEWILKFLNTIVPFKLPGEIELTVLAWISILAVVGGIIAGLIFRIKRG